VVSTHTATAVFALYAALLFTTCGMGLFGSDKVAPRALVGVVGVLLLVVMTSAWFFVRYTTNLDKIKDRAWPP
jgi:hypothetical protein